MLGLTKSWYKNYSGVIKELGGSGAPRIITGTVSSYSNIYTCKGVGLFYAKLTSTTSVEAKLYIGDLNIATAKNGIVYIFGMITTFNSMDGLICYGPVYYRINTAETRLMTANSISSNIIQFRGSGSINFNIIDFSIWT